VRPWTRMGLGIAALALASSSGARAEPHEAEPARLSDLTDELQRIQIRMAQGDKTAYPEQLKQLRAMGAAIAAAKPETWKKRGEVDSLVIYVLSGGAIGDVGPLLKSDALLESERPLARGALAYITNHEADAVEAFAKIDLDELDARLAGQVAFARSVLETKRDPKTAISLLDWARLVAPGTLVEEAALRREIAVVAESGDAPRVAMLTRQYATRYPDSLYAEDFFRELARLIARYGLADEPANYLLLSGAAAELPADSRRAFLLNIAKAAVVNGRFDAASAAANEALKSARPGSPAADRARLYLDAGRILSDGYDAAASDLGGLSASELDRSDAGLLASVRSVAAQLRTPPSPGAVEGQSDASSKVKPEGSALTIVKAEEALKRTAGFAEGAAP